MAQSKKKSSGQSAGGSRNSKSASSQRSKTAANSKNSKGSSSSSNRSRKKKKSDLTSGSSGEIIAISILAFCIFTLIANFGVCGVVGDAVSGFFFGIIGFCQYIFPVYFFVSAAFLMGNRFDRDILKKVIYFGVVMILFSMLFQVIYSSDFSSVKDLYMDGYKDHRGGGVICGGIFFLIRKLLGVPGTCIVMFIVAVAMFILITEISLADAFRDFVSGVKKTDYDDIDDDDYDYDMRVTDEDRNGDERAEAGRRKQTRRTRIDAIDEGHSRPRPSLANLDVYANDTDADSQGRMPEEAMKPKTRRDSRSRMRKIEPNQVVRPKDFFDKEEVHELTPNHMAREESDFELFSNDVEKIVMEDEEFVNPVQVDVPRQKSREGHSENRRVRAEESAAAAKTDDEKQQRRLAALMPEDDIAASKPQDDEAQMRERIYNREHEEDVLAGAVNGNIHPETVSDYDPLKDSAFAEDNTDKKSTKRASEPAKSTEKKYEEGRKYKFPTADLLNKPPKNNNSNRDAYVRETAIKLKNTLETFGVNVTITNYSCGPAVTRFEMQPEQGVKVSKILNLADDIKLNLAAADIRIEAPIPGKAAIGIEVPNKEQSMVAFRELIESDNFKNINTKLAFAVGKDISGQVIATDIAKMPHLLIAGATGSGKSVCINTLIMSILYKATPEEVKLIMIDPKMVELACYNGIPHLLIPVVTDPKKAAGALNWAVVEMTRRYQLFAEHSVRNIQGYNDKVQNAVLSGADGEKLTKMPQIVVIVDELADLMMVAHGEVEDAIVRLSQLARAAGIHLVIATQRPSVDVITGLIKANVPSRIAFSVSSGVDSRTILDMVGAEKLLGKGDMLFYPTGYPKPVRVQGAFVSDDEVTAVVDFLKNSNGVGTYDDDIEKSISGANGASGAGGASGSGESDKDDYFVEAGRFIIEKEKASIGMLQRTFKIGFNRAARIMDQLTAAGVVGPEMGTKARSILMTQEEFDDYIDNNM